MRPVAAKKSLAVKKIYENLEIYERKNAYVCETFSSRFYI